MKINYCYLLLIALMLSKASFADNKLLIGSMHKPFEQAASKQILELAYQRLNIKVEFIYLPAERSLNLVNQGLLDAEDSRITGLEKNYPNLVMLNTPVEFVSLSAYSKKYQITVQDWQSLKPYRIVYLRGVKVLEKNLLGFKTETVTDIQQAFMMLEHDRVDIVIADRFQANHLLSQHQSIHQLTPELYHFPVFHYLNKKHTGLIPKLEAILKQFNQDGMINKIKKLN